MRSGQVRPQAEQGQTRLEGFPVRWKKSGHRRVGALAYGGVEGVGDAAQ